MSKNVIPIQVALVCETHDGEQWSLLFADPAAPPSDSFVVHIVMRIAPEFGRHMRDQGIPFLRLTEPLTAERS